ncbi:GIY-YIG nuclease family protein [Flagellimonas lutimaris]|uniref:GIY-YIG nuclease family protein n=1 Tax=Flagellimonas lutimaris TaxID=475082 RepID=UPI003F5CCFC7
MENDFTNKAVITKDPFSGAKRIRWRLVGGHNYPFGTSNMSPIGGVILNTDVGKNFIFSFEHGDKKDFITFYFFKRELYLKPKDIVIFEFSNGKFIEFEIIRKSELAHSSWSGLYYNNTVISEEEIDSFKNFNMLSWGILDSSRKTKLAAKTKNFYWYTGEQIFYVIKQLASEFVHVLQSELPDHQLLKSEDQDNDKRAEGCHVYLMVDTTNDFYKIGISNKPQYREKTLQSQKPTIELICSKEYPKRVIAETMEGTLHKVYGDKRIRGEWFELNEQDVNDIKSMLESL